jgi:Protein of unknown function (DUF3667)
MISVMVGEAEAAGDVLTGGVIAGAIEAERGASAPGAEDDVAHEACRNCGATLGGPFCARCGQAAHIHRSLLSLGHDILHGVFHFEGRIWRTLPQLFFHPGRLTRRYIDGERAKFVSPMALFLFTVFLMFAVFSFTGGALLDDSGVEDGANVVTGNFKSGNQSAIEATDEKLATLREQLEAPDLSVDKRADLARQISELESARGVMEALASGDWGRIAEIEKEQKEKASKAQAKAPTSNANNVNLGWPALDRRLSQGLKQVNENPSLLIYKLKTNGYKFSWALIPLSIPFLWLLFFWRRDIHLYDHAIFVTYSITFMMLLLILSSLAAAAGLSGAIWGTALVFVPPIHMYKQLRGAYGLSRFGACVRLFFLLIVTTIVLILFTIMLFFIGVLG